MIAFVGIGLIALASLLQTLPALPAAHPRMRLELVGSSDTAKMFELDARRPSCTPARARESGRVLAFVRDGIGSERGKASDDIRVVPLARARGTYRIQFRLPANIPVAGNAIDDSHGIFATIRAFTSCAYVTVVRQPARSAAGTPGDRSGFYFMPDRGIVYVDVAGAPSLVFEPS
jgi:hypothetical protein